MPSETQEAPLEAISGDTTISQSTAGAVLKKPKQILGKLKSIRYITSKISKFKSIHNNNVKNSAEML